MRRTLCSEEGRRCCADKTITAAILKKNLALQQPQQPQQREEGRERRGGGFVRTPGEVEWLVREESAEQCLGRYLQHFAFPLVVKPVDASCGIGVRHVVVLRRPPRMHVSLALPAYLPPRLLQRTMHVHADTGAVACARANARFSCVARHICFLWSPALFFLLLFSARFFFFSFFLPKPGAHQPLLRRQSARGNAHGKVSRMPPLSFPAPVIGLFPSACILFGLSPPPHTHTHAPAPSPPRRPLATTAACCCRSTPTGPSFASLFWTGACAVSCTATCRPRWPPPAVRPGPCWATARALWRSWRYVFHMIVTDNHMMIIPRIVLFFVDAQLLVLSLRLHCANVANAASPKEYSACPNNFCDFCAGG